MAPIRRKIIRKEAELHPYIKWNAYVDLLAMEDPKRLTEFQKSVQRIFHYNSEVYNGGHSQYFDNKASYTNFIEVIEDLNELATKEHVAVFEAAFGIYQSLENTKLPIRSVVFNKLANTIQDLDMIYYELSPSIHKILEKILEESESKFIEITD